MRASGKAACYSFGMLEGWEKRLWGEIDRLSAEGVLTERSLSISAGHGANYLGEIRRNGKTPTVEKLRAILDQLGDDAALYVLTGLRLTDSDRAFLDLVHSLPEEKRDAAVRFFRDFLSLSGEA